MGQLGALMSRSFDYCVNRVLHPDVEGGEVNDPRDPGGHTNLGVTQGTLDTARRLLPDLPLSVAKLTAVDARRIYEALYWRPIRGDELPLGLALIVFDAAVNQGVEDARRFLQVAIGVKLDGQIGPKTIQAANTIPLRKAIVEVAAWRMFDYMQLDRLQGRFGLGWSRRLMRMVADALSAPLEA